MSAGHPLKTLYRLVRRWLASLQLTILLPLFAVLLLTILWSTVAYQLAQERSTALKQASDKSVALAQAFEARTNRVLQQVYQVTQFIQFEFQQDGGRRIFPALMASDVLPARIVNMITVLNASGKVIASNHALADGSLAINVAIRKQAEYESDRLYISPPVFNRTLGQWMIQLSRRLNHPDGSFAGAVLVFLPQAYFTDFYPWADLGRQGSLSLLGTDGVLRAVRVGNRMLEVGQTGIKSPADASPDRIRRIVSYRQLRDFPLIAVVGLAETEAYARFAERRSMYLRLAASASILILAFIGLLVLLSHRLRKSMLLAEAAQATFRAAAEGGLDAFYILKAERDASHAIRDFIFMTVNPRAAQLFGQSERDILGQKLLHLLPASHTDGFFAKCIEVANAGRALEEECEVPMPDGSSQWWQHQRIPLEDGIAVTSRDISQRKRIETENRNSHTFLQSLIDYLPTLIYVKRLRNGDSGRMIVWNKTAENVTGYRSEMVLGKTLDQIFPARLAGRYQEVSDRMLANPQVIDIPESPFRRADGKLLYLRTISVPLFDVDGKPEYLLGIGVDITGRRAQELELRTKQAELAAANDSSPLGLFHTDANGHCTYVNRTYEEISGLAGAEALGAGWARSVHPQDRLKVFQAWGQATRERQPYQGTYRFAHKDGRIVWVSVKTAPILVDGKLQGYVGSVDDITARRSAEKALLKSEQHLRTIADTLPALVAYVDSEQRFRFNNLAYERLYGMPREAIQGKTVRELLGETMYLRMAPYIECTLFGETVSFEIDEHRQGRYRCFELTYTPQFDHDEDGRRVVGFHVMGHDITSKKMHERRLVKMTQIDSLTGLLNRAGFQKKLADAMSDSRKSGGLMALIYMDIDYFKQINDTHGHPIGDALLKSFVARLSRALRSTDSVARLGGDEFTIIMEKLARPEDGATIAGKIGQAMQPPFSLEGHTVKVTVSIGLAYYQGGPQKPEALLKQADDMLYQAKKAGRNTYRIAPP